MRRERPDHSMQATDLVHEAFLRLAGPHGVPASGRAHFFALAAQVMRHILVDHARARARGKRVGERRRVPLEDALEAAADPDVDLVALDQALHDLAARDERKSRVVELRYFGGLSIEETAEVLGVSEATVRREWTLSKALLRRELRRGAS